jgi:hypothetical protein
MHNPQRFPCEVEGCGRGEDKPFNRQWNLKDHQRRVHSMQPSPCGKRNDRSRHSPEDQYGQDPTTSNSSSAATMEHLRDSGYSSVTLPQGEDEEDEEGEEDEEDYALKLQEARQSRASWSTARYPSAKADLSTVEPTVHESPARGSPTLGFVEQLGPKWASFTQRYQQVLGSPSDPSAIKSFKMECFNMYKFVEQLGCAGEEEGYSNLG